MEHQAIRRHPRRQRHVKLAACGYVDTHALLVSEAGHCFAQERLRRIGDSGTESTDSLATTLAQVLLVVDEQRRAELGRELVGAHATNGEHAVFGHCCMVGQKREQYRSSHGSYIESGADTPSRVRPATSPMRADSTSERRAWVRSGATSSPST